MYTVTGRRGGVVVVVVITTGPRAPAVSIRSLAEPQDGFPAGARQFPRLGAVDGDHHDVGAGGRGDGGALRGAGGGGGRLVVDRGRRWRGGPLPSRRLSRADRAVVQVVPATQRDEAATRALRLLRGEVLAGRADAARGRYTRAGGRHTVRRRGTCCAVLFFSRPRSEGWSHHGRTFSIYPCPLSF